MDAGVPRVPRRAQVLVGAPTSERKLHRVGLADDDHSGAKELLRQGGGDGGAAVAPHRAAAGCNTPIELHEVLERNRDAVQRPDRMPRADGLVSSLRRQSRLLFIDLDERVELAIEPGDALQASGGDLHGRDAARLDVGGQRVDWQVGELSVHKNLYEG